MVAMTRTGMCWAYSSAASTTSRSPIPAMSSLQYARVEASSFSIAWGANAGSSRRRAPWWNGGSDVMGGAIPAGAISMGGRNGDMTTLRDVNRSVS